MLKAILVIAIVLVVAVGGILIYALATQPDTFRVQRSAVINAPSDKVYGILTDLRRGSEWSPFENDPAMKRTFSGPATGPGSALAFEGGDSGAGTLKIAQATPSKITLNLDMTKPMTSNNIVEYTLAPKDNTTNMTWSIQGPMNVVSKVMCVFMSMDKMIGSKFEKGLRDLKTLAEK